MSSLFRGEPRSPAPLRSFTLLGSCLLCFLPYVSLSRVKLGHDWPSVKFAALSGQSSSVVLLARAASAPLSSFVFSIRGTSLASLLSRLLPPVVPSQSPVSSFTPPNNETKQFPTSHFLLGRPWVESTCASQGSGARVCSPTDMVFSCIAVGLPS